MTRFELALLGLFTACWLVLVPAYVGVLPIAGAFPLALYPLYGIAASLGWLGGNVLLVRWRQLPTEGERKRLGWAYYLGPASVPPLVRALAPTADRFAAPFVPLYALAVYTIFFLVPLWLMRRPVPRDRAR